MAWGTCKSHGLCFSALALLCLPPTLGAEVGYWTSQNLVSGLDGIADIQPTFRFDNAGTPWTIWNRQASGSILSPHYTFFSNDQWVPAMSVYSSDPASSYRPAFCFDSSNVLWLAWHRDGISGAKKSIWFSTLDSTWSQPSPLAGSNNLDYYAPSVDSRNGHVWATWFGSTDTAGPFDIFAAEWQGNTWSGATNITASLGGYNWFPDVAVDSEGNPHIVWVEMNEFEILYSKRQLGTWSAPEPIHDPLVVVPMPSAYPQVICTDPGQLGVVWTGKHADSSGLGSYNIYYSHFDSTSWHSPILVSQDMGTLDIYPDIRGRASSDLWVTWSAFKGTQTDSSSILVSHFDGAAPSPAIRLDSGTFKINETSHIDVDLTGRPWVVWWGVSGDFSSDAIMYSRYLGDLPTPVLFQDLRATSTGDRVRLSWEADPSAFLYFEIERLEQGVFESIGRSPVGADWQHTWESAVDIGQHLFRIAGVRRAADALYLGPISVTVQRVPPALSLKVLSTGPGGFPLNLNINAPLSGALQLKVFDVRGRLVSHGEIQLPTAGQHDITWASPLQLQLGPSVYFILGTMLEHRATARFVVK